MDNNNFYNITRAEITRILTRLAKDANIRLPEMQSLKDDVFKNMVVPILRQIRGSLENSGGMRPTTEELLSALEDCDLQHFSLGTERTTTSTPFENEALSPVPSELSDTFSSPEPSSCFYLGDVMPYNYQFDDEMFDWTEIDNTVCTFDVEASKTSTNVDAGDHDIGNSSLKPSPFASNIDEDNGEHLSLQTLKADSSPYACNSDDRIDDYEVMKAAKNQYANEDNGEHIPPQSLKADSSPYACNSDDRSDDYEDNTYEQQIFPFPISDNTKQDDIDMQDIQQDAKQSKSPIDYKVMKAAKNQYANEDNGEHLSPESLKADSSPYACNSDDRIDDYEVMKAAKNQYANEDNGEHIPPQSLKADSSPYACNSDDRSDDYEDNTYEQQIFPFPISDNTKQDDIDMQDIQQDAKQSKSPIDLKGVYSGNIEQNSVQIKIEDNQIEECTQLDSSEDESYSDEDSVNGSNIDTEDDEIVEYIELSSGEDESYTDVHYVNSDDGSEETVICISDSDDYEATDSED